MKTLREMTSKNFHPAWFLVVGIITLTMAHLTFGVDVVAWVSSVPFLIYLSKTKRIGSRILFSFALIIAWSLAVLKIITTPIPMILIPLYSLPIALIQLPGYMVWAKMRHPMLRSLIFPMIMVIMEWVQYTFSPFASWGVAAYTQVDSPAIAQSVSLFGIAGLSFLIYWINAVVAEVLISKSYKILAPPSIILALLLVWGALRLDYSRSRAYETMTVAAVGTDSEIGGLPLPSHEENVRDIKGVFERTRLAAQQGAELVVWNEAAFLLMPDKEAEWTDSIQQLAAETQTAIVASYVVPLEGDKFRYENKYRLIRPDGSIHHEYYKHQPVPGEPAIKGNAPQKTISIGDAQVGAAICYDYDFPYIARDNKKAGADVIGLPSSDWRGIDPIHTQMATFRAIEQGTSIVRSTRFGLSAAITPYGVMTAQMSSFNENSKVMVAQVPSTSIATLYSIVGDAFVWLCLTGLICIIGIRTIRTRYCKQVKKQEAINKI